MFAALFDEELTFECETMLDAAQLIQLYHRQDPKDDLILTCLIELMENSNYWKWTYSQTFKDMLASPDQTMPITPANVDAIIEMARNLATK